MYKFKFLLFFTFFSTILMFSQQNIKHKVVKGETIYAIAREYNITINKIYELNPTIKGTTLRIGDILQLPKNTPIQTEVVKEIPQFHKVVKGESFYSISKKYELTVSDLELLNPHIEANKLKKGTILTIVKQNETDGSITNNEVLVSNEVKDNKQNEITNQKISKDSTFTVIHVIQPKETKYGISKKYEITVHELETLNPTIPDDFPIGYQLIIKRDKVKAETIIDHKSLSTEDEVVVEKLSKEFTSKADLLIDKASQYLGIRYKYGGTTENGFDCSGLMCVTFKEIDLSLPRTSSGQATYGEKIETSESQKGDLIFFATGRKKRISHVGMITEVNDDEIMFIHASTTSGVMISSSKEPYYASRIVQVNRVLN